MKPHREGKRKRREEKERSLFAVFKCKDRAKPTKETHIEATMKSHSMRVCVYDRERERKREHTVSFILSLSLSFSLALSLLSSNDLSPY
jgi:hypothetical protein